MYAKFKKKKKKKKKKRLGRNTQKFDYKILPRGTEMPS